MLTLKTGGVDTTAKGGSGAEAGAGLLEGTLPWSLGAGSPAHTRILAQQYWFQASGPQSWREYVSVVCVCEFQREQVLSLSLIPLPQLPALLHLRVSSQWGLHTESPALAMDLGPGSPQSPPLRDSGPSILSTRQVGKASREGRGAWIFPEDWFPVG